jgi:integron integrase
MASKNILPEFQEFLLAKKLVPEKNVYFYALWVNRFLTFINKKESKDIPILVEQFLDLSGKDTRYADWQIRQANEALSLYLDHFKTAAFIKVLYETGDESASILTEMRNLIRIKHYSYSTERTYLEWANRFFAYIRTTRDKEITLAPITQSDIRNFLSHLALEKGVSSSTQNQAFNALLFLFREVLGKDVGDLTGTIRAKRGVRLPVVLTVEEIKSMFSHLSGRNLLIAQLLYGSGLRLMECARLRVKDADFDGNLLYVRSGKGDNDRTTILPKTVKESLKNHLEEVKTLHEKDLAAGYGEVYLPDALSRKYPKAGKDWAWQYVFPANQLSVDPRSGKIRRHHISDTAIQSAIGVALRKAAIPKHATVHTLIATHMLMNGVNIREVQELLGHKNVETTMIYTHVIRDMTNAPKSPLDVMFRQSTT